MRTALPTQQLPDHLGLAYEVWAPLDAATGKIPDARKGQWLAELAAKPLPSDYAGAYRRWKQSFDTEGLAFEVATRTRLLIGHGNAAPTEVGLTFHHTWGVPIIPGSALKGLLSHYLSITYGPADVSLHPGSSDHPEPERAPFQGPTWKNRRIRHSPGEVHAALFGAPDADSDQEYVGTYEVGQRRGAVVFHDAWLIPDETNPAPLAVDVITTHHSNYYMASAAQRPWPNDYEDPTPISFLSVRPGVKFFIALSGDPKWVKFAAEHLADALADWGIGSKSAAGYGRMRRTSQQPLEVRRQKSDVLLRLQALLDGLKAQAKSQREMLKAVATDAQWKAELSGLEPDDKQALVKQLNDCFNFRKAAAQNELKAFFQDIGAD